MAKLRLFSKTGAEELRGIKKHTICYKRKGEEGE